MSNQLMQVYVAPAISAHCLQKVGTVRQCARVIGVN